MHPRSRPLLLLPLLLLTTKSYGQTTTEQLVEEVAQNSGSGGEFTFTDVLSRLEFYARHPLDLNRATPEELADLHLLTTRQVDALLDYRDRLGGLLSIYELQSLPAFDVETLRRLHPFVAAGSGLDDVSLPLRKMLAGGDRELFARMSRRLGGARGYERPEPRYAGNPWRHYFKYRQRFGKQLSVGLVAEKDPGEPLFRRHNRWRGFDYYSAHFFLRGIDRRVRAIALGDFSVSFGQGLILYTGFGFGKSSLTTSVARNAPTLQPYAGVSEFSFMRGAGTTLQFGDWEVTVFGSRRRRTGNLSKDSTSISSMSLSGLSRTDHEIHDRGAVAQHSYGGSVQYEPHRRLRVAVNFLGEHLSLPLLPREAAYNQHYFRGRALQNISVDYRYRLANLSFFGEVAGAMNAGMAVLQGLNLGLGPRIDLAAVYRNYARDYRALSARPFGETSGGRNEEGGYLGIAYRPAPRWRINAYVDFWRHPYLRFGIPEPSAGREFRLRVTYAIKRRLDSYAELRSETKARGVREPEPGITPRTKVQLRLHAGYRITPALEWRSRLDVGYCNDAVAGWQDGWMLYQDLHYRPLGALSVSGRLAVFMTDGYDVRFYQYENGLTYNAFVTPYYHRGGRGFLLLRYKGLQGLTLEARVAHARYFDERTFGSGLEATGKRYRTEVGGQVVWRW